MSNSNNTGMRRLRKDKKRLQAKIAQEKLELFEAVEEYKNSLWPVKVIGKFRKTAESLSENKFLIIGAQLAYAALSTVKQKVISEEESKGGMKEFLKNLVGNFIQQYMNKNNNSEEESAEE